MNSNKFLNFITFLMDIFLLKKNDLLFLLQHNLHIDHPQKQIFINIKIFDCL